MSLLERKGKVQRVVEGAALGGLLKEAARSTLRSALDQPTAHEAPASGRAGVSNAVTGPGKPGLIVAGGVAGVTAASAAVSAVRRRQQNGSS